MAITKRDALVVLLLSGLWGAGIAFAHSYLPAAAGQSVTVIPDISVSRAAYREITSPDQVDVFEFSAVAGQALYIQMTVPVLDRLKGFAPAFALVYMGTEPARFDDPLMERGVAVDPPHAVVDRIVQSSHEEEPPIVGVAYDQGTEQIFDEPFTGTRYWIRQTLTVKAPADGTYRLGVYAPDGGPGKYVLAPGKREQFGIEDVFTFPGVRITVRQFCEQPVWPDLLVLGLVGAAVVGGIGLGIYALAIL